MSELISGKEALIAICDGIDVEHRMVGVSEFGDNPKTKYLLLDNFLNGSFEFRLKPRTITINNIEVPAPFEPKDGDVVFVLANANPNGFSSFIFNSDFFIINFGTWRTESEIKQVVEALRSVFKPQ